MKPFKFFASLTAAAALVACEQEANINQNLTLGDVIISNAMPKAGDSLTVTYAKGEAIDNIIMHYGTSKDMYMQDLDFTLNGETAEATLVVPDSATSLAFDFMEKYTSLNDAVVIPVYSAENTPVPGAYLGHAMYFRGMGKALGHTVEADSIFRLYETDLTRYPDLKPDHEMAYASWGFKADKEKGMALFKEIESRITAKEKLSMEDYSELEKIYRNTGQGKKADSINNILLEQFPNSDVAIIQEFNAIQGTKDLEEKEKVFAAFIAKHPEHRTVGYLKSNLASAYAREGDFDRFMSLNREITEVRSRANAMNSVAWSLVAKGENLEEAAAISKRSLELIEQEITDPEWNPKTSTRKLTRIQLENSLNMYRDTYALILYKQGDIKGAITYQGLAAGPEATPEVNERYIQFLIEDQQYKAAQEKAAEYIIANAGNAKIKEYLEIAFTQNGNEGTYKDLLATLEMEARENLKEEILEKKIDEEAAGFTLRNIEGGEVALADLKGKTVVLDFWATWCGPCIASFPGMQKALDKYKDNEDVVFLFIDTFERGTDEKRITMTGDFIKKNNYSFTVLLDAMDEETNAFEVADNYGVTGIPTKFVIGPDGHIKFKSVGWGGSIDGLVTELDMMIELAGS
ncbi:TlpA disulfide reductase family protein [Robertkochia flava]|uniref:TlpA disulfide reductase family protein n=1 Tax=Robertkochia flava TaxID=3447986 RepID=UPI001CCCFABE|nr:TlpA disulfide reductase family protein [Robertkochia marina]